MINMLIDSVVIKLKRVGMGVSPEYNITIYGHGKLVYEGKGNVKIIDEVTESIDKDKIAFLLSKFKEIDFFSLNDVYPIDNAEDRPYTIISLFINDENNKIISKIITHYHGDRNVPRKLIELEDKIDKISKSEKWVGSIIKKNASDSEINKKIPDKSINQADIKGEKQILKILEEHEKKSKKSKKLKKSSKKKQIPKRLIAGIILFIIIVFLLFFTIQSGFIDSFFQNNDSSINDNNDNSNGDSESIYMSAKMFGVEKSINYEGNNITISFESIDHDDILIIEDKIDYLNYSYLENTTILRFNIDTSVGYFGPSFIDFIFEGNISESYNVNDSVKITVTILRINYSIDEYYVDEELFKEQWGGVDYIMVYDSHKPLPQSCLELA